MEIAIVALLLIFGIPIIAILSNTVIKLVEMRMKNQPPPLAASELSGEQALFGLSAAEDLRELKARMDRMESQISQIAGALQGAKAAPRTLDPIVEPPRPERLITQ